MSLSPAHLLRKTVQHFRARRAIRLRARFRRLAHQLPPLPAPSSPNAEMHILAGAAQADMGLWAAYSFLRYLPHVSLVVHSDGTFTEIHLAEWRAKLPGLRLIIPAQASAAVDAMLSRAGPFPHLTAWRPAFLLSRKLLDFHAVASTDRLLVVDTDVLCFGRPDELIAALVANPLRCTWNRDAIPAYCVDDAHLSRLAGLPIPSRINSGLMVMPPLTSDHLRFADSLLAKITAEGVPSNDHWMEQTLYACLLAKIGGQPLPQSYDVEFGRMRRPKPARHYVGIPELRVRFFTEGLPLLFRSITVSRKSIPDQTQ